MNTLFSVLWLFAAALWVVAAAFNLKSGNVESFALNVMCAILTGLPGAIYRHELSGVAARRNDG